MVKEKLLLLKIIYEGIKSKSFMKNKLNLIFCTGFLMMFQMGSKCQTVPVFSHIVVVIGENTAAGSVFGNVNAPYINSLATAGAKFTNSYAITHPSQPNYLDLYSGNNQGIINDNLIATKFTSANLGAELINASKTYTTYSDGLPSVGYNGATSGKYARKHNPAANWMGTGVNQIPITTNQPFTAFPANYNNLPGVCFVVPDLCHDGHDVCAPLNNSVQQYDTWVQQNLDGYKQWCINNNSLLIVTYDEDDNSASNKIATVFYGAHVVVGVYSQTINHYNLLRTLEDAKNQSAHAGAAASATPIDFVWSVVVPLKLISFTGNKEMAVANLHWETENEINFSGFEVERSCNGSNFVSIAGINATGLTGSNNYSFLDRNPVKGIDLYRLKQMDLDGNFTYSKVVAIDFNTKPLVIIAPNPTHELLNIKTPTLIKEIRLIACNGNVLKTWTNVTNSSNLNISSVSPGVYILKLLTDTETISFKILKD